MGIVTDDNRIDFPRQADPLVRTALVASDRVNEAAQALAMVADVAWAGLSPAQMQRFREMALLAAIAAGDDGGASLVAYAVEYARRGPVTEQYRHGAMAELDPITRAGEIERLQRGLRFGGEAMYGLHLDTLQALRQLRDSDAALRSARLARGQW